MIGEASGLPEPLVVDRTGLDLSPSHRGVQHDARSGWGALWIRGSRERLQLSPFRCEARVERRFLEPAVPTVRGEIPYRPPLLARHPDYTKYYDLVAAQRPTRLQRLTVLVPSRWRLAQPISRPRR